MMESTNVVSVAGRLHALSLSHKIYGEAFYTFFLECGRLSNQTDMLPVTVSQRLLSRHPLCEGIRVGVRGQLRSYNKLMDGKVRLCLTIFAQGIDETPQAQNEIELVGYVCKPPVYRVTPFGREITDMLIAVNRAFGKSDYIPCIVWGANARYAQDLEVGDKLSLLGRVQSRAYQKTLPTGETQSRTAYEVSVSQLTKCEPE